MDPHPEGMRDNNDVTDQSLASLQDAIFFSDGSRGCEAQPLATFSNLFRVYLP